MKKGDDPKANERGNTGRAASRWIKEEDDVLLGLMRKGSKDYKLLASS